MLKDLFKKKDDKVLKAIADGYVDIKAYKYDKSGNKKLIYHDTGDNTVTDWMRHAIALMLSGYSFSTKGVEGETKPNFINHNTSYNPDGYCLNGNQFLWATNNEQYPIGVNSAIYAGTDNCYALFPTKVLLGTGKEYISWEDLRDENEEDNSTWYTNIVKEYGDGSAGTAQDNFEELLEDEDNIYSGTIATQGNYIGSGDLQKAITVNDPDTTSNTSSSASMATRVGVVGAIKTLYDGSNSELLDTTVSDTGRLLKGPNRGAGKPCFLYFRRPTNSNYLSWALSTSDVYVSNDSTIDYLNRITFKLEMPAQSSSNNSVGEYYPFNNYTFKQLGLFNDALFDKEGSTTSTSTEDLAKQMPNGMLLAIKNIQSFTKTADTELSITWTLTL